MKEKQQQRNLQDLTTKNYIQNGTVLRVFRQNSLTPFYLPLAVERRDL